MSRHFGTHDYKVGDEIAVTGGGLQRIRYPGVVDRVTRTQVHVTYDASRTGGTKTIRRTFWGATGSVVGDFPGGPRLSRRVPNESFA